MLEASDGEVRRFLARHCRVLLGWVAAYGACDLTHFSVPYVGLDGVQPFLLSRYALLLPAVLALRGALSSSQATARGNSVAAVCLLALPFCALLAVLPFVGLDASPCLVPYTLVPCAGMPGAHPLADCGLADCDGDGIEDSIGGAVGDLRRYHSSWCEAGGAHTVLSDHASDVAAAAAAAAGSAVWHCAIVADFLAAVSGRGAAPAMPPSAPPPPPPAGLFHGDDQEFYCSRVELGGADLCHHYTRGSTSPSLPLGSSSSPTASRTSPSP